MLVNCNSHILTNDAYIVNIEVDNVSISETASAALPD